jgi:S1-C subfamily serine protease
MPYGYSQQQATTATDTAVATDAQSSGLVEITSTLEYGEGEAAGTGIILSSDGIVVTNHHVVEGATAITVTDVSTGATYTATVLGYNSAKDIAVLQLQDASGLTPAPLSDTATAIGDEVTAVGDANGDGGTLTASPGTVTQVRTSITVQDETTGTGKRLRHLIEVDADIISGDSGGALLDTAGEVVGMNVAASSGSADVTGYVIPLARVLRVAEKIEAGTETKAITIGYPAFLGVELGQGSGATIAGVVADSPAESLGLAAGDTVTSIGGTSVSTATALSTAVAAHEPGDTVTVTWTDSSGTSHSGSATLVEGPVA